MHIAYTNIACMYPPVLSHAMLRVSILSTFFSPNSITDTARTAEILVDTSMSPQNHPLLLQRYLPDYWCRYIYGYKWLFSLRLLYYHLPPLTWSINQEYSVRAGQSAPGMC